MEKERTIEQRLKHCAILKYFETLAFQDYYNEIMSRTVDMDGKNIVINTEE